MRHTDDAARIRAIRDYIEQHLQEKITVREIADSLQLHPSYTNTFFSQRTGESIKTYIRRRKMQKAAELIQNTNYSLTQIGASLGYFDQSHFSRTFQKETGMSPGRYRILHCHVK